jgi:hypothetical protein
MGRPLIRRIKKVLNNPRIIAVFALNRLKLRWLSDEAFLKLQYKIRTGLTLNLDNPRTFNEKLQYLKINDRRPEYTMMVDKHSVKEYVAGRFGEEFIIPTLGVWEHFDEIDFAKLPEKFVLKCTHDSGTIVICRDKARFDREAAKKIIEKRLRREFYSNYREWPYKHCKPRIIAESYMEDESGFELKDYKIFCFDEEPVFIQVDFDRFSRHKRNLYTTQWEFLEWSYCYPTDGDKHIQKPEKLDQMLKMACELSRGIKFVRIDFYSIKDEVYFGECTFFPEAGFAFFSPDEINTKLGDLIIL